MKPLGSPAPQEVASPSANPPRVGGTSNQDKSDSASPKMKSRSNNPGVSAGNDSLAPRVLDESAIRDKLKALMSNINFNSEVVDIIEKFSYLACVADERGLKLVLDEAKKVEALIPYDFLVKIGRVAIMSGNTELFERLQRHEPDIQFAEGMEITFKTPDQEKTAESDIAKSINIIKMSLKGGASISGGTKIELSQWAKQRGDHELLELLQASDKVL